MVCISMTLANGFLYYSFKKRYEVRDVATGSMLEAEGRMFVLSAYPLVGYLTGKSAGDARVGRTMFKMCILLQIYALCVFDGYC